MRTLPLEKVPDVPLAKKAGQAPVSFWTFRER